MKLDLRINGRLSVECACEITRLEPLVRKEYNDYIGALVKENKVEGLTWLMRVTCRNTYMSFIHAKLCRLALLQKLLEDGFSFEMIVVDKSIKSIVNQILKKYRHNTKCIILFGGKRRWYPLLLSNLTKSIYRIISLWLWPKILSNKKKPTGPIYYLDSFLYSFNFDEQGIMVDRYYPGLLENIEKEKRANVWYAPTLMGVNTPFQYYKIFKKIRKSETKLLMKEDWLKLDDYLRALYLSIILPNKIKVFPMWREYNISSIVKEEIRIDCGNYSIIAAALQYYLFKRLAKDGVKIKLVIDWFENQVVDRALNIGVKEFYPNVTVKGYQGFVAEEYLASLKPTCYEQKGGTLPDEICIIGSKYASSLIECCSSLKISVAPAFRFQNLITYQNDINIKKDQVLMALPMGLDECRAIVKLCLDVNVSQDIKFVIKPHPTYSYDRFVSLVPESKESRFLFSDKPLIQLFQKTMLLVTSASSACLEAVIAGVPVVIVGSKTGPTKNPLHNCVDQNYWSLCFTSRCIEEALNKKAGQISLDAKLYFSPVSVESVSRFLDC